jgi:flagellar hook assembly protein FlgD
LRKIASVLAAALLAGLAAFVPSTAPGALAATNPKVAIIVGATHGATASYRSYADQIAAVADDYTTNVVKVYSPNATWSKVKSAVANASIVVYLGHGNGWPSPYTYDPEYTTKNGFGLNYDSNGDGKLSDYENRYYGEPYIETLDPAPNAVVLLFHLCYASGNSEPGHADPTLSVAKQRVDNYASAFLRAGARAVIANGHSHDPYYIRALFTTKQTIEQYWRNAPDFHNRVSSYASSRTSGMTYLMDPESAGKYYRSITGKMSLRTEDVTGADYASTSGDPASFVIPGNASVSIDGAPVYPDVASAAAATGEAATLPVNTWVKVDSAVTTLAIDGSRIFAIHAVDGDTTGFMRSSTLVPRDSAAPRLWETSDGTGAFSPNGDDEQDTFALSLRLSESASWTLQVVDGDGNSKKSASGTGDQPSLAWAPAAGSVADGTYRWKLTATDGWGNGPLTADGNVVVDTIKPTVSVAEAEASSIPTFTPNGDGSRDTISFAVGSDEPGTIVSSMYDTDGDKVQGLSATIQGSAATITWNGRTSAGAYAPDGRYTVKFWAKDRAGNTSASQARLVDLYGALGFGASTKVVFFPQDADGLAATTTFSFKLLRAATVTWTVIDDAGTVVRTLKSDESLAAGTHTAAWNGRDDAGAFVARGRYRSLVRATNGTQETTLAVAVLADAFKVSASDATPARKQKITITATSAERLAAAPRLRVYQPGIDPWSVTMTKIDSRVYRVTVTLKASSTGTLKLRVYGADQNGQSQGTYLRLPLH